MIIFLGFSSALAEGTKQLTPDSADDTHLLTNQNGFVEIRDLGILSGTLIDGAAIDNAGSLTLRDVVIWRDQDLPPDKNVVRNTGALRIMGTTSIRQ